MLNLNFKKYLYSFLLFVIAFGLRVLFPIAPNIEFVTTAIVFSTYFFGKKHAFLFSLLLMFVTDLFLGNTRIYLFTWTGFIIPGFVLPLIWSKFKNRNLLTLLLPAGFGSNIFFYLWTNFGVWLLDTWGMYPKTILGLLSCYINGLPFIKNQLLSSIIFIPALLVIRHFYYQLVSKKRCLLIPSR